jgi:hypothetical protein
LASVVVVAPARSTPMALLEPCPSSQSLFLCMCVFACERSA